MSEDAAPQIVALVTEQQRLFDAIPFQGTDEQVIAVAYRSFADGLAAIERTLTSARYDFAEEAGAYVAISTIVEAARQRWDDCEDGGDSWEDLANALYGLGWLVSLPLVLDDFRQSEAQAVQEYGEEFLDSVDGTP